MKTLLTICFFLFASVCMAANVETIGELTQIVSSQQKLQGMHHLIYEQTINNDYGFNDSNESREVVLRQIALTKCKSRIESWIDSANERRREEESIIDFNSFSSYKLTNEEKKKLEKTTRIQEKGCSVEVLDNNTMVMIGEESNPELSYGEDILEFGDTSQYLPDANAATAVSMNGVTGSINYKEKGIDYEIQTFPDFGYSLKNLKIKTDGRLACELIAGNYATLKDVPRPFPIYYRKIIYASDGKIMFDVSYEFSKIEKTSFFDNKIELPKGALVLRRPKEVNGELVIQPSFLIPEAGSYSIEDLLKLANKKSLIKDSELKERQERGIQQ